MYASTFFRGLLAVGVLQAAACELADPTDPNAAPAGQPSFAQVGEPAPSPLVTVAGSSSTLAFWPYTTTALGGPASDPMNLAFPGADVRSIRAALMMLDGNRTAFGFPTAPPFNCTWKEA